MASPSVRVNTTEKRSPKSRFRQVLIASIAVALVGLPVSLISERFLPAPLVVFLDSQFEQDITAAETVSALVGLLVAIVAIWNCIQLYRLRSSARPVAIALTIACLPAWMLFGPIIESPLARIFSDTSVLLWGAAMAMMYCKPYSELFVTK